MTTLSASVSFPNAAFRTPLANKKAKRENAGQSYTVARPTKLGGLPEFATPYGKTAPIANSKTVAGSQRKTALVDKTPFPNRQIVFSPIKEATKDKIQKPQLFPTVITPPEAARPSSTRTRLKLASSVGKIFQTPEPSAHNPWDVSDVSIALSSSESIAMEEDVEDGSEVEYMPPTAIEETWEPDFAVPDFKAIGQSLRNMPYYLSSLATNPEDFVDEEEVLRAGGFMAPDTLMRLAPSDSDSDHDDPFSPSYDIDDFLPVKASGKKPTPTTMKPSSRTEVRRPIATRKPVTTNPRAAPTNANIPRNTAKASTRKTVATKGVKPKAPVEKQPPLSEEIDLFGLGEPNLLDDDFI
ncbi:hypothetical protein SISNIDRAFT_448989 [Sistotremastrum niveocremeum HHB9708]|uniref:Uncharacterized protein n=1 Tax=Sistotremastrum niveocremeum HHB9708 TaxID=1314777 RepID=A0A165AAA4_9AGAM|nr:hypothetical protein SISNIDRAFT_448989 [Sistotremastrum niveocremeum HHB9708]